MYIYIYAHVYICIYTYIYIYVHTHTHVHWFVLHRKEGWFSRDRQTVTTATVISGNHLSNTAGLTQVFSKAGEYVCK